MIGLLAEILVNKLDDFEFDSNQEPEDLETGPVESSGKKLTWLLLLLLILVTAAGAVYWLTRPEPQAEPEATPAAEPSTPPASEPEPEESEPLPTLGASDDIIRRLVGALSSNPRLAAWLATDDLVRRFVTSVANVSEGLSPKNHVDMLTPKEPFSVLRQPGSIVPSSKSYARYDAIADVVSSLDVNGTIELYRRLGPLIDEAFAELGYPGRRFDDVLVGALDHLLATPVIGPDPELRETVTAYEFADPDIEALSGAQKQLLRTGPGNVAKIQTALRALRTELLRSADS